MHCNRPLCNEVEPDSAPCNNKDSDSTFSDKIGTNTNMNAHLIEDRDYITNL